MIRIKYLAINKAIALGAIAFCDLYAQNSVQAQVIEDNTLSTEVNSENNRDFTVNAGDQRGNNLFHSFREFSIPNNGSVFFNNAISIQNIITRITGSSISEINGLIQSNGTANLFLINPNGIIFGENATLNIGGSFIGTTAESLVFEDGSQFSTNQNNLEPLLTVSVPLGLQFGNNPGKITNQANFQIPNPADPTGQSQIKLGLTTPPGKTLALLGGDITFDGGAITATAGNIELGSVAENSFVSLNPVPQGWNVNYEKVSQFRDLEFNNLASVTASGEGGGSINIQGRRVQVLNGSAIFSDTVGAIDGGDITLEATELIEITGSDPTNQVLDPGFSPIGIFFPISSRIITNTFGSGDGGDIIFKTPKLSILDSAKIQAQTVALPNNPEQQLGASGDILITNATSVELKGLRPLLGVADNAQELFPIPPEARAVLDLARLIEISRGSRIDIVSASNGPGGDINIFTDQLKIKDGSSISNSPVPPGIGNGGNININAQELIEISGSSIPESELVGLITSNTFSSGNAGNVNLSTNRLLLQDGGGITAGTLALGNGGEIVINTQTLEIIGTSGNGVLRSGLGSETFTIGDAGDVNINTERLTIKDQGQITVRGLSSGTPGNLFINANTVELNNSARITAANASATEGGNIQLHIKDNITLQENSIISAQAFANANGGNIDLDAKFIIAFPQQNNDIVANAIGGNGGNIAISALGIFGIEERNSQPPNITNDIDASSNFGTEGRVTLVFPQFTATQGLFNLPPDFVDVDYLFKNQFCQISQESQYIITGRGGIPRIPDDDLLSENTWSDWRIINQELETVEKLEQTEEIEQVKKIEMIQGWVTDRQGNIVLTANPTVVTPHKPELSTPGCNQNRKLNFPT
ncbi:S-layer family protein [Pleurocapsa sp. PCC 7319]|uniref:beta strand repeat-containing protein n=1 Tax=Pleurocapsa sp. PCC 7319 TaxID=118161 RepID=UPI00035E2274|nr:S-layer family protein [Pleurocapsa sp. PCC 7319]